MFGYVDSLASSPSYGSGGAGAGDDITGTLENPYARTGYASAFDLAWAVDAEGNPVTFKNGIHYVKVQTAVYQAETCLLYTSRPGGAGMASGSIWWAWETSAGRSCRA